MLEMEPSAGYHATGRAVSFWEETYGGLAVQPLTTASGPMLAAPDPDFCESPFLTPRRTLHVGRAGDAAARDRLLEQFGAKVDLVPVDPAALVPGLRPEWSLGVLEPGVCDIDVAALHQAGLRRLRRLGGEVRLATALRRAEAEDGGWRIETGEGGAGG